MTPEVEKYVADLTEKIAQATQLDGAFLALRRAADDLNGLLTLVVREGPDGPHPDVDVDVANAAELAHVLNVLSRHGFRRVGEPRDCPDMLARRYSLTGGVVLWAHLSGASCKRVQVGVIPQYAIECS